MKQLILAWIVILLFFMFQNLDFHLFISQNGTIKSKNSAYKTVYKNRILEDLRINSAKELDELCKLSSNLIESLFEFTQSKIS
ncbi:MAG: hypothetical protein DKM50_02875 [Candidatus Margulisiibacteriota bacterium]|nr:MAG: hypothetical protein A2X43_03350 [Candidatus Margulisbacteria bacterium GWD2_39_127]OGI02007.1 MAG: hypothetical protein A2X42_09000 [Candidatus Margulisbacteria bacterium GWF2_38_17]OGI11402.1 MAG: hypothetical protein A2X41_12135 [Candidatus Margulisbacteria bacterium GWE2_39_32]PZM83237.1 MAG: hypothetical protein DKM50_02875 [Candidatus Margulisiibacteriota bacterium]HAR62458.1 hypothetical protein [Candidatus Margulisiibacteriota bacterium]